jgi:hypothetical protein
MGMWLSKRVDKFFKGHMVRRGGKRSSGDQVGRSGDEKMESW